MKKLYFIIVLLISAQMGIAQKHQLPPVWKDTPIQQDSRIRSYISPTRIVWKSNNTTAQVNDEQNLMRTGIRQSILGSENVCRMRSTTTDTASILLDFGRELQGGVQIVTGQSPIIHQLKYEFVSVNPLVKPCAILMEKMVQAMTTLCAILNSNFLG